MMAFSYDAFFSFIDSCAEVNIFSAKMPYPFLGLLTKTWVTAPTSLLF